MPGVPTGLGAGDTALTSPINSVLTADGIIMGDDRHYIYGNCGVDCTACYDANHDDNATVSSESAIDTTVVRQFDAAFATFLYKNPAFTSMSHTTLQRLRSRLLKESAKNIKVEAELRTQLAELRDAKRNRELELQRELLVVTRAKAAREAELIIQIQKTRRASMMLDNKLKSNGVGDVGNVDATVSPSSPAPATDALSDNNNISSPGGCSSSTSPQTTIRGSDSFEEFQREIRLNQMEQAHIIAEMEKIKRQIAEETLSCSSTPTP